MESLDNLSTGDVLLYRTNDFGAKFNACVQNAKWSHVGVIGEAWHAPFFAAVRRRAKGALLM